MRYVGLLRAVNVAGTGKLSMGDLRALVASLGYTNVATFIASGNVLFDARASETAVAKKIEDALRSKLDLDTKVLVRTADQLAPLVTDHAFRDRGMPGSKMHVVFLSAPPTASAIAKLDPRRSPPDEIVVRGREVHWLTPDGAGRSKLSNDYFERTLGVRATTRNHNTVTKLFELLGRG